MALISTSSTPSHTSAEAARPRAQDQCVVWCACLPYSFSRYQIMLLRNRGNGVRKTCL